MPAKMNLPDCSWPTPLVMWSTSVLAYLTDDDPAELAFYCPVCAEREFGDCDIEPP
jgi:hypothetical protein